MFSFTSRVKDNIGASSMVDDASYIDTESLSAKHRNTYRAHFPTEKKEEAADWKNCWQLSLPQSTTPLTYYELNSMLLLPKEPMKPRLHDDRVGYFAVSYKDFDENPQGGSIKRISLAGVSNPKTKTARNTCVANWWNRRNRLSFISTLPLRRNGFRTLFRE